MAAEDSSFIKMANSGLISVGYSLSRTYLMLMVPFILVMLSVRLVMSPQFLSFEYYRADFPPDTYGFSADERLTFGTYAVNYLINQEDLSYLADLRFPDGQTLFNDRELKHMEDVQTVTYFAYTALLVNGILTVAVVLVLYRFGKGRHTISQGIFSGAVLTLSLIGVIVMVAVLAWDVFFDGFHTLFFADGTWRFAYSDTLIRLFPERLWFDAAMLIGGLTALGALVAVALTWPWSNPLMGFRLVVARTLRNDTR